MPPTQRRLTENSFNLRLETDWLGQSLEHYQVLESTQVLALERARAGCKEGLVIVSDRQTSGKGTQARTWHSNHDGGIWLSFVLHPNLTPIQAPQLTLLTATVLTKVINDITGLNPEIKWPNDILIGQKKVAGILTETKGQHNKLDYAVVGIGLNVNQLSNQLNEELRQIATSLKIETNESYSKQAMIQAILTQFELSYEDYLKHGFPRVKENWLKSAYRLGEKIQYTVDGVLKEAIFRDLSEDGCLIVLNELKKSEKLYSAEISWF